VPVRPILEAAVESALPAATAKRVGLVWDCEDGENAIVCDAGRMQQVIWNLLSNAIKFTPEGGRVALSERRDNSSIVIEVTDTGAGIEPEFLPHVFDRFRQQDPGSTRKHGGLGLGLSIVRHLVTQHGGTIEAFSEGEGLGSTFVVRVPLSRVPAENVGGNHAGDAADVSSPSLEGVRVLVVDNEPDARSLVRTILEGRGATVTVVESASAALEEIRAHRPDVLVSDIAMPEEDGYTLIRKVRRLEGTFGPLPAAALTAYATASDRAEALLAGYQAHLAKPVEPAELAAVVASLARRGQGVRP
jgi:CheY-like chemotaxis protein